ncbi:MAG TPA: HAMP domain-containing sensor histidine kinase [Ktedonobacterales bacterium]|nr:HAMP domain-containing sensor histidine kinase [Ktedonobacterales bacterium]
MRRITSGVRSALARIYLAPFRSDPRIGELSVAELELRRRAQLLRLLVVTLTAVQVVSLVGQLLSGAPQPVVVAQVVALGVGVLCLWLNQIGWTLWASLIYICASAASVIYASLQSSNSLDGRGLVIYGLLSLFVVLAGLVLPRWAIWVVAAGIIAAVAITLQLRPLGSGVIVDAAAIGGTENVRIVLGSILTITYSSAAILTWIFARSSYAGTMAVARAFERERELAALKDQFIVDANHELRTPMMALYGNIELALALGEGEEATGERTHLLQRALHSGDAVLSLLSSVLDAGVLQAGHFFVRSQPLVLKSLVLAVLETFDTHEIGEPQLDAQRASTRAVTVKIDPTLVVLADELRLRQILVNLLSNTLKYSDAGTPIAIDAHPVTDQATGREIQRARGGPFPEFSSQVQVNVRDKGLGVPPKDAPRLFQRFVRLERDIAGAVRGTGVGLYLCRELVHAMDGDIWLQSSGVPGEGSTFSFTLPALSMAPPETPCSAERKPTTARPVGPVGGVR